MFRREEISPYNAYPIQTYVGYLDKTTKLDLVSILDHIEEQVLNKEIGVQFFKDSRNYVVQILKEDDPLEKSLKTHTKEKPFKYKKASKIISKGKGASKQIAGRKELDYLNKTGFCINPRLFNEFKDTPSTFKRSKKKGKYRLDLVNLGTASWTELVDKEFFFQWIYDFRGRVYSLGYEVNPHGGELQRYGLDFTESRKLNKTGMDAIYMHITTLFGKDKLLKEERIKLGKYLHATYPPSSIKPSLKPIQLDEYVLEKSIAYFKLPDVIEVGMEWNIPVEFDVTNSGLQIMGALTGCETTCKLTNLVDSSKVYDSYTDVAEALGLTRKEIKKPMMSHFYNSVAGVRKKLGTLYSKFVKEVSNTYKGPSDLLGWFKGVFDDKPSYEWRLPDNFLVRMDQYDKETVMLTSPLFEHGFQFTHDIKKANGNHRPLLVNLIHSIDAYLNRCIIRKFMLLGKPIAPVHDAWLIHPNDVDLVKTTYKNALEELVRDNYLAKAIKQIYKRDVTVTGLKEITSDNFII